MAAVSPEARVGHTVASKYQLISLLGKGGMGAVYEAEHRVTGRRGALKLMHVSEAWSEVAVERFLREARIVGSINHPNIVEVLDAGVEEGGAPYAVFTLLRGETVRNVLLRKGKLTVAQALHVSIEVLEGLGAAHARGVVHRDIKPDNVFLDVSPRGEFSVRILDFGISKITDDNEDSKGLTKTGTAIGTAYYMSPEQIAGDSKLDARADIFSLGAMLYRMLSGKFPFDGKNANMVMMSVLTKTAKPLKDLDPTLPTALCDAVHRAIHKDREQRFASTADMVTVLTDISTSLGSPSPEWASVVQVPSPAPETSAGISRSGSGPRLISHTPTPRSAIEPGLAATTPARAIAGARVPHEEASGRRAATALDGTPLLRPDAKGDTLSATVTPSRGDHGAGSARRAPRSRIGVIAGAATVVAVLGVSSLFAVRSFRATPASHNAATSVPTMQAAVAPAPHSVDPPAPVAPPVVPAQAALAPSAPQPTPAPAPEENESAPGPSRTSGRANRSHGAHGSAASNTGASTAAPASSPSTTTSSRSSGHSRGPITDFDDVAPHH